MGVGNWEVKVDRPCMLPSPATAFSLDLYDVAAQHHSLVNNGHWEVFIFCWRLEQHFLARTLLLKLLGTMGFVKVGLLHLFL